MTDGTPCGIMAGMDIKMKLVAGVVVPLVAVFAAQSVGNSSQYLQKFMTDSNTVQIEAAQKAGELETFVASHWGVQTYDEVCALGVSWTCNIENVTVGVDTVAVKYNDSRGRAYLTADARAFHAFLRKDGSPVSKNTALHATNDRFDVYGNV